MHSFVIFSHRLLPVNIHGSEKEIEITKERAVAPQRETARAPRRKKLNAPLRKPVKTKQNINEIEH